MAIYLDSADLGDARSAADLGFCEGFTTNPIREFEGATVAARDPVSPAG